VKYIALRCAGFNNVDLDAAKELGLKVVRVPAYSPEAVAEHAIGMMMSLNRRIHRAYQRTRDANFSLEGLTGFTMYGKTAGVIGTGKIGVCPAHSERLWHASAGVRSVPKRRSAGSGRGIRRPADPVLAV
jgi:lactate dehydrogenase-like 2-hydroxyacid dehydrogenase